MELKPPKPKKKSSVARLITWSKMYRTPLLLLLLLGTTSCDESESSEDLDIPNSNSSNLKIIDNVLNNNLKFRHQHSFTQPSLNNSEKQMLSDIKYLRKHLNREIVNFVMTDSLVDGEVEIRVHYNGVTAKETSVGADGHGLKLRQLTDGRHLIQVIYTPNGDIQDCEVIAQGKSTRNFLRYLRKELKLALDEENYRILQKDYKNSDEQKFYRDFGNVTFRLLKSGDDVPREVASWLDYDKLKAECLRRHEELRYMMETRNKVSSNSMARSRRSMRENFIVPGTKWCGAGQLAEQYHELGADRTEDRCCRTHDNCRVNIGGFKRRFGYFNFRPFTISHCRCDRRFRACLKLADTSVSNMVGKLFFNIVQTKCFVLKPVKACTKRSWWGKCLRRGYTKQAFLRDNLPY
ncbi:uncharacterized protein LOC128682516 isoform X2 [Plodia interpunctella]|uniref:uncharacterized protein LOC128682516 isoform X2 n=1 Tax=Plodia interpunctella TaxID=58824 RepID=UPI0023679312|nr:uncharacterized protein LOC128682516 isoform X2 [Plodia interpunctella]